MIVFYKNRSDLSCPKLLYNKCYVIVYKILLVKLEPIYAFGNTNSFYLDFNSCLVIAFSCYLLFNFLIVSKILFDLVELFFVYKLDFF